MFEFCSCAHGLLFAVTSEFAASTQLSLWGIALGGKAKDHAMPCHAIAFIALHVPAGTYKSG
jgi:hypothetical protein